MRIGTGRRSTWFIVAAIGLIAGATFFGAGGFAREQTGTPTSGTPVASPAASPGASPIASPVAAITINIANLSFETASIEIPVGTTVTWVNKDIAPHTVTHRPDSGDALFDSGMFVPGESWSYTFTTPGTYNYYCIPHPNMVGKIIVTP